MSTQPGHFCDAFLALVYGAAPADPGFAAIAAQPGFAVYRNTVVKACVDALAGNFPAVERLTGTAWFRSAAAEYARAQPPTSVSLLDYGATFPAFLASLPSTRALPYLAQVARLEQLWLQCHAAADEPVLVPAELHRLPPEQLGALVLPPHACARWHWCAELPVVSIWHANRSDDASAPAPEWQGEGLLLTRPGGRVAWRAIGPGTAAFLDACAAGTALAEAAAAAVAAEPALDLASMLASLLDAEAFTTFFPIPEAAHAD
jgi:hypothetical protein